MYEKLYKNLTDKITSTGRKRTTYMHFKKTSDKFFGPRIQIPLVLPETITYTDVTEPTKLSEKITQPQKKTKKTRTRKRKKKSQNTKPVGEKQAEPLPTESLEKLTIASAEPLPVQAPSTPKVQAEPHILDLTLAYDERVLNWLDPAYQAEHPTSILYHTAPLILEKYILANNITVQQSHARRPQQKDTAYQSAGEIIYPDGTQKTVIFTLVCDPNNICYHVGYEDQNAQEMINQYFAESHWNVNFPPLASPAKKVKPTQKQLASLLYIIFEDNIFCVRIKDLTNNVILILYKKIASTTKS